jgi:hypothetical protein
MAERMVALSDGSARPWRAGGTADGRPQAQAPQLQGTVLGGDRVLRESPCCRIVKIATRAARKACQGRARVWPAVLFWLVSYAALAWAGKWLWQAHSIVSSELVLWDASRILALRVHPPDPTAVLLSYPPLIPFLALISGSAANAAALLGATVATLLSRLWRRAGVPWLWLMLILLHPVFIVGALERPEELARAGFLAIMLYCDLEYLAQAPQAQGANGAGQSTAARASPTADCGEGRTGLPSNGRSGDGLILLYCGAFAFGALALVDAQVWPLCIYAGGVLVLAQRRAWLEHLSVLLVALVPAAFLSLAWSYLGWAQRVLASHPMQSLPALVDTLAEQGAQLVGTEPGRLQGLIGPLIALCCAAPACVLLLQTFVRSPGSVELPTYPWLASRRGRIAIGLLLATPVVDLLWNALWNRDSGPVAALLLALLAVPLLWRAQRVTRMTRRATGFLLVLGLLGGWVLVLQPGSVLQRSVQNVPMSYRDVAGVLNDRLQPGQHVLLDEVRALPLVALIDDSDALVLANNPAYGLAQLLPASLADYVVVSAGQPVPGDARAFAGDFDLLFAEDGTLLYSRRQP